MSTIDDTVKLIKELPDELQAEVRDFARHLRDARLPKPAGRMKLTWRGALRGLRDRYTSVDLQHKIRDYWVDAAVDGCPSAEAIRRELGVVGTAGRNSSEGRGRSTPNTGRDL